MNHPFSLTAEKLKALTSKLNMCTYNAVFGRTLEERQRSTSDAQALGLEIDYVLSQACDAIVSLDSFMKGPRQGFGLLAAANEFIQAVETPRGAVDMAGPMQSTSCTAMPSPR